MTRSWWKVWRWQAVYAKSFPCPHTKGSAPATLLGYCVWDGCRVPPEYRPSFHEILRAIWAGIWWNYPWYDWAGELLDGTWRRRWKIRPRVTWEALEVCRCPWDGTGHYTCCPYWRDDG